MPVTDYEWVKAERDHELAMERQKTEQARIKADSRIKRWQAVAVLVGGHRGGGHRCRRHLDRHHTIL